MIASRGLWVFRKLGKKGTKIKARNTSAIKADETVEINGRTMRVSSGRRDSKGIILFSGRVPRKFEVDTCCQWVQCPSSGWSLGTCRPATSKIIISRAKKVSIEEQVVYNWFWVNSCEILRLFWGRNPNPKLPDSWLQRLFIHPFMVGFL